MSLSLNNLTFIIVTFKSEHIIHECINSLPIDSNIIVVENSMDEKFKNNLEKQYPKIEVYVQENMGMGSANNKGIKLCKTDYAFVINPDVKFESNAIDEIIEFTKKKKDYAILAPISDDINYPNYIIKNKTLIDSELDYLDVDSVDGFAMLLNKRMFKEDFYFDENFFLYLENDDLCLRKKNENKKIYVIKKAKINHLGGKSPSSFYAKEIEYSRNWHWMWSKFYFNKKHFGYLNAFTKSLSILFFSVIKFFYYSMIKNKHKQMIYKMRFLGLFNSLLGKKSWYRPNI